MVKVMGNPTSSKNMGGMVLVALAAIVALGFWLRIFRLYDQSYWGDEVMSMVVSRMSPLSIVEWIKVTGEPHPPLYYLMLHAWTGIVGENELATRFLSAAFGTLSLAVAFVLGKRLLDRRAGLVGALLLATNPLNVLQSRDARMYSVLVFLTLLSSVALLSALRRTTHQRIILGYVLSCLVGLFVHYYFGFVLVTHAVFLLLVFGQQWWLLKRWLGAGIVIAVAYIPWLVFDGGVLFSYQGYARSPTHFGLDTIATAFWSTVMEFTGATVLGDDALGIAAAAFALGLLAVGFLAWTLQGRLQAALLIIAFLLPIASIYLASLRRPIFLPRYLIEASPAFLLIMGGAIILLSSQRRLAIFSALLVVPVLATSTLSLANSYFDPNLANPDYRGSARLVQQSLRDGDGFVFGHWGVKLQFTYYYGSEPLHYLPPGGVAGHESEIEAALTEVLRVFDRVWFIPYWKSNIDLFIEDWLDRHAYKVQNQFAGKVKTILYSSPRQEETGELIGKPVRFANGLFLDAAAVGSSPVEQGRAFNVSLDWSMPEKIGENLKAALRLVDEREFVYGSVDRRLREQATADWLPGQRVRENRGVLVETGTPPGDYRLELVLYRESNGQLLDFTDQNGVARGGALPLGMVRVSRPTAASNSIPVPLTKPLNADLNDEVRLLGASVDKLSVKPGESMLVAAFWRASGKIGADYTVTVRAVNSKEIGGSAVLPPAGGRYPTSHWGPGEVVRDFYQLNVFPKATAGNYLVMLGLTKGDAKADGTPETEIAVGSITVKARDRQFNLPSPSHALSADFGGSVRLLGYDLSTDDSRTARMTLYWQALSESSTSYTVFVHLIDSNEKVWGQSDSIPGSGAAPTTGWVAGEVIADRYQVPLRAEAPSEQYLIEVGVYDARTGTRLKRDSGEDRIILQEVSWR